ncbi:Piwi-domain-containing protein [Delitschia confertaspora ATCC 74209]|uniref:Piwi-domain-containing protein n=1 Tax=Delitschia confertaspora ATCC 74209 TaxID=1513339 RepID=A0A9P4JLI7_9PLEO|nr:Piwi-domain-containing protein [Delitschia confertaspora ATCC 74209]
MAGPNKKRADTVKKSSGHSKGQDSRGSSDNMPRSSPKRIGNFDGANDSGSVKKRKPEDYIPKRDLLNISDFLGMQGWYAARGVEIPNSLPSRPAKFNSLGKAVPIKLNTFNVSGWPTTKVHQYDISWDEKSPTKDGKRGLMNKIWNSKAAKEALGEPQSLWIYDGHKLAWANKKIADNEELRITVDLDAEQGRTKTPGAGAKNTHTIFVKWTRSVDFAHLDEFLNGKCSWTASCIDTVNFLDHVLREGPSHEYTQIKKSFFARTAQRQDLGQGVEAFKGVFSSLRPVLNDKSQKALTINVDVANGTFWRPLSLGPLIEMAFTKDLHQFQNMFKIGIQHEGKKGDAFKDKQWKHSNLKRDLSRLRRVQVVDNGYNKKQGPGTWTIEDFPPYDPYTATFPNPDERHITEPKKRSRITVADYFEKKYGIKCTRGVPVVQMTKKISGESVQLPIDVLKISPNQRYNSKLSDVQTSNMIKFAVTLPAQRWQAVQSGVQMLDWANDKYLKHYGIKVNPNPSTVAARQLPLPQLHFDKAQVQPHDLIQGRWRLDGKRFIMPALAGKDTPLTAWGICVIQGRDQPYHAQVENFAKQFVKIFESHGVKFGTKFGKAPAVHYTDVSHGGEMVTEIWNKTGNHFKMNPQLLFFIINDRNIDVYRRLKKSCDCRYGVPSQMIQSRHAKTASPQYISNVCMKVNAKLGGVTSWAKSVTLHTVTPKQQQNLSTMVIAADVSHPAPGAGSEAAASYAAITMSCDEKYTRYWAECNTNGNRVEMVTTENIKRHMGGMAKKWMQKITNGNPPQRVLYIRDGVSEGQYAQVLDYEVEDMKATFKELGCKTVPKFTVVIAGKRHHVRFFPGPGVGDRNGNPKPGTLVETGVTHPFEFDWYLNAHVAIKGTARPIHYQCILNEADWNGEALQQFIFEHSFQYCRSTTPVSLHPAVYYAHLAADRSRAHENKNPESSGKKPEAKPEQKKQSTTKSSSSKPLVEIPPLIDINNKLGLKNTMWYV